MARPLSSVTGTEFAEHPGPASVALRASIAENVLLERFPTAIECHILATIVLKGRTNWVRFCPCGGNGVPLGIDE